MKPSVILYKSLPDDLLARLESHFNVTRVSDLSPQTVAAHADAFSEAQGLLGSSEKWTRRCLRKCPRFAPPRRFP